MTTRSRRVLRVWVPLLATLAVIAPLAWFWQASRVPDSYSAMDMGYLDYGGGPQPDASAAGHAGHDGASPHTGQALRPITELVADPAVAPTYGSTSRLRPRRWRSAARGSRVSL